MGSPIVVDQATTWADSPAVAVNGSGGAVVAWGAGGNVYLRRYGADGVALGNASRITTSNVASDPAVAISANGNFAIAYRDDDGDQGGIFAKMYASDGTLIADLQVNMATAALQTFPRVAMDAGGNAVVVWHSNDDGYQSGIYARKFAADGTPATGDVRVNQQYLGDQRDPAVAMTPGGDLVVAFSDSYLSSGCSGYLVRAERMSADLAHAGAAVTVSSCIGYSNTAPAVAVDPNGNFVVAYQLNNGSFEGDIVARRFAADGAALSASFTVSTTTPNRTPTVTMDKLGDFTIAWPGKLTDGSGNYSVFARAYAPDGTVRGDQTRLTQDVLYANRLSGSVDAAMDDDGDLWATWNAAAAKDIVAARFKGAVPVDLGVTVTDTADPVAAGQTYTYIVYVTNHNDTTQYNVGVASGVVADISLPLQATVGSITADGWSCSLDGANVVATCRRPTLSLATPSISIDVTMPVTELPAEAHVSVIGIQDDPFSGNDFDNETTVVGDFTPDAFTFVDLTDVALDSVITSNTVTITGVSGPVQVSVAEGTYSIDGAPFTGASGTIGAGQTVRVQHLSSASFGTTTNTVLTVGGVSDTFSSTTLAEDTSPDPFAFIDQANVQVDKDFVSNAVTIGGINVAAPIQVSNGSYSIDGGAFRTVSGTIRNGQSVRVQQRSSASFSTTTSTILTVGDVSDTFSTTTAARDVTPDPFAFTDQGDVPLSTVVVSDPVAIGGYNDWVPISVSGGEYSVNGGAWTTDVTWTWAPQNVRVRHASSASHSGTTSTTLMVGEVSDTFSSTTLAQDMIPDPFSFQERIDVPRDSTQVSDPAVISGITKDTPIAVTGGEYSIDNGPFTAQSGVIAGGQAVAVRHMASSQFSTQVETILSVGQGSATFRSRTIAPDVTPDPFSFVDQAGVARAIEISSNPVTITGIDAGAPISVSGGEYSLDEAPFTAAPGTVSAGQVVTLRQLTSSSFSATVETTLTVGSSSDTFSTTTEASDTTPDPFDFPDRADVERSIVVHSQAMIFGLNDAAALTISGGEYSLDGAPFTGAPGTITNGQYLIIQQTSSAEFSTTLETVVTIGGVSGSFLTTTVARDTTPDPLAFDSRTDVALNSEQTSGDVLVTNINDAAPIGVANGAYSIDGGPFTAVAGTVTNLQSIRVRHTSAASFSTQVQTTLTIGDVSGVFSSTTLAQDVTPEAFTFQAQADVDRNAQQISNTVLITGINDAAPVSVTGGAYSIDGGPFTTAPAMVGNGQSVVVSHTSSGSFSTAVSTMLTVGGISGAFTTTTLSRDVTPDPFRFGDQALVPRSTDVISSAITVTGINDAAPVSVTGGAYSVDGGPFTTAAGIVMDGQSVRVQHTSAAEFFTLTDTVLTIGGVSDRFSSETESRDITPDGFSFTDVSGASTGVVQTSEAVAIAGVNDDAPVSVSGGEYSVNGGAFTSAEGAVSAGDEVRVRHTSSSAPATAVDTTLTVGGVSDTFTSTTGAADTTPDAFMFVDVSGVRRSSRVTSNAVTIGGINAVVAVAVSGGDATYSKNGGAFTSAPGTVAAGDSVRVRVTAASIASTTTNVAVTIGGVSDTWSVTTGTK